MSKIMSLDKQLENKAKKWLQGQMKENKLLVEKFWEEDKQEVIEQYLEKHPKIAEQYYTKKKRLAQIKLTLFTVGAAITLGGVYVANINKEPEKEITKIEAETLVEDNNLDNIEENSYEEFFTELKETKSEDKRDELITNQTKEIIVEAYNKEHLDNPITADRLETLILNENVLEKKDRLGNCTYERVPQNVQFEQTEEQKLVKIGNIYEFKIDGQTVAVFDKNGDPLFDKNVENQDMSFQKMVVLVKKSNELKDIYKYRSNDSEKGKVEEEYGNLANALIQNEQGNDVSIARIEK